MYCTRLNPIRTSTFYVTAVCLGLPAVVWALHVLHHHRKSGSRISAISIFLLLSDLLELVLNSTVVVLTFGGHYLTTCQVIFRLLFGARVCGHHLHQLVALESVVSLRYPSAAAIFSQLCSTMLCTVEVVLVTAMMYLDVVGWEIKMCLSLLPLVVLAVTCLLTCKPSSDQVPPTNRKLCVLVQSVAMITLVFIYVPYLLEVFINLPFELHYLVSLRVMPETLLCVLVCTESVWLWNVRARPGQSAAP